MAGYARTEYLDLGEERLPQIVTMYYDPLVDAHVKVPIPLVVGKVTYLLPLVPDDARRLFDGAIDRRAHPVDRVSAIDLGTGPVAYHFAFLQQNPIVNDVIGDTPVVIFFDKETESAFKSSVLRDEYSTVGSSAIFNRELRGQLLTFETRDGDIRDIETGTTWTVFGKAIKGELSGHELEPIIHGDPFWFAWAAFKPDTRLIESTSQLTAG